MAQHSICREIFILLKENLFKCKMDIFFPNHSNKTWAELFFLHIFCKLN